MKKERLELNKFNCLNDKTIYTSDTLDILNILVKPRETGYLEVVCIMRNKPEDRTEYYSYHHFETHLKDVDLETTTLLDKLTEMYLNDDLSTEGDSCSGNLKQIQEELANNFSIVNLVDYKLDI